MTLAPRALGDLLRLIDHRIPEGTALEYKARLDIKTRAERLEVLKDLTGMGNGGGGTVIYGMAESTDELPVAIGLCPEPNLGSAGVLEDVVRAGVRPPLLMTMTPIEVDGGMVLVVEVVRTPLGPYMAVSYDEWRYYMRIGTRTAPMTEQQVRDAYVIATRGRDNRGATWGTHALPITAQGDAPWLTVSGIPEEPLHDFIDPADIEPEGLVPPAKWKGLLELGDGNLDLNPIVGSMTRWAGGVFAHDGYDDRAPSAVVQVHRDGAAGVGLSLRSPLGPVWLARAVNGLAGYLGWLWHRLEVRTPIEVVVRLDQIQGMQGLFDYKRALLEPPGTSVEKIAVTREVLPNELVHAGSRHALVLDFADRFAQAYGVPRATPLFRSGQLYGSTGELLGVGIAGNGVWGESHRQPRLAVVYDDGTIRNADSQAVVIGFFTGGVVLDENGDVMAVLEMAPGPACPGDFLPLRLPDNPHAPVPGDDPGTPYETPERLELPPATGRWSGHSLAERFSSDWKGDESGA